MAIVFAIAASIVWVQGPLDERARIAELTTKCVGWEEHGTAVCVELNASARQTRDPEALANIAREIGSLAFHPAAKDILTAIALNDGASDATLAELAAHADRSVRTLAESSIAARAPDPRASVSATLIEATLGDSIPEAAVGLRGKKEVFDGTGHRLPLYETTTDNQGRARWEGVLLGEYEVMSEGFTWHGPQGAIEIVVSDDGQVELGKLVVFSDPLVSRRFGSLCEATESSVDAASLPDLLVFERQSDPPAGASVPEWLYLRHLSNSWTPPWKAVVCIEAEHEQAFTYVDSSGKAAGTGMRTSWKTEVIRLVDDRRFERTFRADPPGTTLGEARPESEILLPAGAGTTRYGDPSPQLRDWLEALR